MEKYYFNIPSKAVSSFSVILYIEKTVLRGVVQLKSQLKVQQQNYLNPSVVSAALDLVFLPLKNIKYQVHRHLDVRRIGNILKI